jgi:hypothetical protein
MGSSSMRHLSITAFLTAAFLLSMFMFPWWAAAMGWFAIAVVAEPGSFYAKSKNNHGYRLEP